MLTSKDIRWACKEHLSFILVDRGFVLCFSLWRRWVVISRYLFKSLGSVLKCVIFDLMMEKDRRNTKITAIHPEGDTNVWIKFHSSPSSRWDLSLRTSNVNFMVGTEGSREHKRYEVTLGTMNSVPNCVTIHSWSSSMEHAFNIVAVVERKDFFSTQCCFETSHPNICEVWIWLKDNLCSLSTASLD